MVWKREKFNQTLCFLHLYATANVCCCLWSSHISVNFLLLLFHSFYLVENFFFSFCFIFFGALLLMKNAFGGKMSLRNYLKTFELENAYK